MIQCARMFNILSLTNAFPYKFDTTYVLLLSTANLSELFSMDEYSRR